MTGVRALFVTEPERGCREVSPRDVGAAMVGMVYGVDVVRIVRSFPFAVSHFAPGLHRPLLWSVSVH